ncbi:conjugal transfer protein MobB [Dysgonomonas sp. 25]|uniref:conjugal transfer protein MobB n=1 Tax=Dysgonomonas sp. 25 TaxID=2302933 RepID=UPI0013D20DCC|nr:conjugal transfer protein MobB [Dysgonomonas sp. 25]NDV70402.1 mobilization protein [Dysgonomonas sp. 25]
MVAKINIGSSLLGALSYNQEKVDKEEGKVLFSNRIIQNTDGSYTMYFNMKSFEPYLDTNKRTEKPVLHISLNPHPDDKLTDEQLSEIAQEYMDKMGYGNQPYLVYKHEDIDRHHLHIVSVRVDENGKKLNDSFEKRRSEEVRKFLEERYNLIPAEKQRNSDVLSLKPVNIKEGNIKKQVSNIAKSLIRDYRFQSINEYRALLNIYGVTVEEVKGEVRDKAYNGLVYFALNKKGEKSGNPFKASLIGRDVGYKALQKRTVLSRTALKDKATYDRTKTIVSALIREKPSREAFEKELLKNGISVVFRKNDDKRIYGATFIDHQSKCVFNGSRMGKEFSANVFHNLFNRENKQKSDDRSWDNNFDNSQDPNDSESLGGLFAMEQHGDNYEEIAFTNRMKRKKRKPRGSKL